jgi:solute carrier family 35 (UDP-sugar transporter), member A1/2/3
MMLKETSSSWLSLSPYRFFLKHCSNQPVTLKESNKKRRWSWRSISLILFVLQNSALVISLRAFSIFSDSESAYLASSAVAFSELIKLIFSALFLFSIEAKYNCAVFGELFVKGFVDDGADCLKLCVPALLYAIQNNLQYVIDSSPFFLVVYQV